MIARIRNIVLIAIGLVSGFQVALKGQVDVLEMTESTFVEASSRAAKPFANFRQAIRDGYRLVGPEFPGMGEHWVHPGLLVEGVFNPNRPAVLSYVRIAGERVLAGVAYALPRNPGVEPPQFPRAGLWHDHTGSVDEEALLLNPHPMHHSTADQTRLVMLHVWTEMENPAGIFSQDNWAIPFFRLGLAPPAKISPQCGKALHLMSGGVDYYRQLIRIAGQLDSEELPQFEEVLEAHRRLVENVVEGENGSYVWPEDGDARLSLIWTELWRRIRKEASESVWYRIERLSG